MVQEILIIGGLVIVIGMVMMVVTRRKRSGHHKVTQLKTYKSSGLGKQSCSYCRKKAKRLSFYADGRGSVIGVCDVCRPQAERQALLRI